MAKNFLLVDNSVAIREVVSQTFEATDVTLRTVSSREEAMGALDEESADIVIADADKADVGGWDLCRALKENPGTESIPVILLSGEDNEASRPLDVVPDAVLSKPFSSDELMKTVAALTGLDFGGGGEGPKLDPEAPPDGPTEGAEPAASDEEEPLDLADLNLDEEIESSISLPEPPPPSPDPDPLPRAEAEEPTGPSSAPETVPETDDLRPAVESAVRQSLSESFENLNEEELRGLIAAAIRDTLKDLTPQLAGMVEQVAREVVPELAEIWIEREIQRLKEED